jgi:septum formation protein
VADPASAQFEYFFSLKLVLASASPRRSLLLLTAGYQPEVRPANVIETLIDGEPAPESVLRLAEFKAKSVERAPGEVVLGADTMVVLDGVALGKPSDAADAIGMLTALSARTHSVLTGWVVVGERGERFGVTESRVTFKELSETSIVEYVEDAEPFDKAGAYAIQGENGRLIDHVTGSRANVMGLPLRDIAEALEALGIERSTTHR